MKSGSLNFLEISGPLEACNGTALHFFFTFYIHRASFIILHYDQQMHSHFTNSHTLDSVETCRSVIICEIIVHLLVIEQNKIKKKQLVERLAFGKFREKDSARKL